jgi:hypothetical protein
VRVAYIQGSAKPVILGDVDGIDDAAKQKLE